jgi:hypothetical protein
MPIKKYLGPDSFDREATAALGRAFGRAVAVLGVDEDEMRREAVAQFIIQLARWDANLGADALFERTIAALGGLTLALMPMKEHR